MENSTNCSSALSTAPSYDSETTYGTIRSSEKVNHIRRDYSDVQLQAYLLQGVSRTFALTIPELPDQLQQVIGNAYLLCRIVDTIEDSKLSRPQKEQFCQLFTNIVKGNAPPLPFAEDLAQVLGNDTKDTEHELIWLTRRVVAITHHFAPARRRALERCVDIMAEGMVYFQENASAEGLRDIEETNRYCYCVAGVVGEMLTELFCLYSPKIAQNREKLMNLSVRFGLALQMTNILKDMWTDLQRAVCWLPRSVFKARGFNLRDLSAGHTSAAFQEGLEHLIGLTNDHLHKAMEYTLLIPPEEQGIRRFCLWSLGMSALTLRKINKNKDFTNADDVKISRNSVKATILLINMTVRYDQILNVFFKMATTGLPRIQPGQ